MPSSTSFVYPFRPLSTAMGLSLSRLSAWISPPKPHNSSPSTAATIALPNVPTSAPTIPHHEPQPQQLSSTHVPPDVSPHIHAAEADLLALAGTPYEKRLVYLPNTAIHLNTISAGPPHAPALLVLHGWGAGAAFFSRNLAPLSRSFRVHLVDWPGFGASSRPPFSARWDPARAEAFFVDAIAEWLEVMPALESRFPTRVHITAHSLGAYLAVALALHYPHRVRNLVLASPVGVPRAPSSSPASGGGSGGGGGGGDGDGGGGGHPPAHSSLLRRTVLRALFALWDAGFTPQMIVRGFGARLGRRVASAMIAPRLVTPPASSLRAAIAEYFYQITAAPCSGELSLCALLHSGAHARRPLVDRLHELRIPATFLYGDRDWMGAEHAQRARDRMRVPTELKIVPDAGHHLYFDNAQFFNTAVVDACDEAARAEPDVVQPEMVAA